MIVLAVHDCAFVAERRDGHRRFVCAEDDATNSSVGQASQAIVGSAGFTLGQLQHYHTVQQQPSRRMNITELNRQLQTAVKVKVNVHTLDIAPLRSESPPQKRSCVACVLKGFHSFTCTPPYVHPQSE